MARAAFSLGGEQIAPGEHRLVDLPVAKLSIHTPIDLPVHVIHGRRDGPTLFVTGALHGDEIIGVEIIRRVLRSRALKRLRGTLLCLPIVNAFGFLNHSRYLPDRRDPNRSFPGSANGSLAAQIAHLLMREIVQRSDFGIDLHSAAVNRTNLPQIRSGFATPQARELAEHFGAPIMLTSVSRDGSLRKAAQDAGVEILVYEAGEALRFDEVGIRVGVQGVLRVMKALGMIPKSSVADSKFTPARSGSSTWLRAPEGGLLRGFRSTGDSVQKDELMGIISNPYEPVDIEVLAPIAGLIIGRTTMPVVNQGDALFHIAEVRREDDAEQIAGDVAEEAGANVIFDEDEII